MPVLCTVSSEECYPPILLMYEANLQICLIFQLKSNKLFCDDYAFSLREREGGRKGEQRRRESARARARERESG